MRPLGVVDVVYGSDGDAPHRARLAAEDGYDHIDVMVDVDPVTLALAVGCPTAFPKPRPGWCATPAPVATEGMWERCVGWFRAAPGALLEPWAGAVVHSRATAEAMIPGATAQAATAEARADDPQPVEPPPADSPAGSSAGSSVGSSAGAAGTEER